jgi:hypothetical protein
VRLGVLALVALTLLMVPTSIFVVPSPSRQLAPPQSYDWVPRTIPSGHYVNFTQISTPHGAGYHVDSIGDSNYAYAFMGCTNETIAVAHDGTLTVWGWFRQSDSFTVADQPGRRHLLISVIYADSPEAVAKTVVALTCDDGIDWRFKNITIYGLCPGKLAWIGIGTGDWWVAERNQVVEWAAVQISHDSVGSSWGATSSPSGHGSNFYTFITPFGLGYHIDSSGYNDYSYDFYGYTNEVFTVGRSGAMCVRGWFRQFDIYAGTYLKEVFVFAINAANPSVYVKGVVVLDYTDGDSWEYKDVVIGGLAPGSQVRIGIGRHDGWAADWQLTAEWACVEILPEYPPAAPGLRWNLNLGWPSNSSVAVADVDSDGVMEAVIGTIDGSVHCVDTLTGTWDWVYFTHSFSDPKPAVGDVNADNKAEIVVATGAGEVYCLDGSGVAKWYRTLGSAILTAPTLADMDGDGRKEILVGSIDGHVSCLDGAGALEWSSNIGGSILYSAPCAADFNGDNKTDVAIGSLDHNLYCLNSTGGLEWNCTTAGEIFNPAVASDINNDGKPEVIAATFNGWIYCVNGDGGVVWSHKAAEEITSPLAVGDINRDNVQEMLMVVGPGFCNLTCLTYPDGLKWTSPIGAPANSDPVIVGLSKAGEKEILLNCGGILNCLSSEGVIEWGHQAAQYMCGSPVVIDVDQDNAGEIMLLGDTTLRCYDYGSPLPTRLQVIVADARGVAISYASIVCVNSPVGQRAFNGSTTSDGDGHVSFISLISGYYVFQVSCYGYPDKTVGTYLVGDSSQRLRVILGDGSTPFDIPVLMVVSAVFLVLLILGVVGLVRRRSDENVTRSRPAYTVSERAAPRSVSATEEEPITPVRPRPTCPSCGAAIRDNVAQYCRYCGANLGTTLQTANLRARRARKIVPGSCIVCGLRFQDGNDTVKCPYCGGLAHRIHMLEWLHVKDYCPSCQKHLEETSLKRTKLRDL